MLELFNTAGNETFIVADPATLFLAVKGKFVPVNSVKVAPSVV